MTLEREVALKFPPPGIIEKALTKSPNERYPSAVELFEDIGALRSTVAPEETPEESPSVAVLPFRNMSPDTDNEYFPTASPRTLSAH